MGAEAAARLISDAVATDDPLDVALVERVRGGESAAFDELVSRHTERAFRIAFRVMRHREDAEDLVQDAWIAALRGIDDYDLARPFAPWFNRILVNRGLNARKRRTLRETDSLPEIAASRHSPERDSERAELRRRVAAALDALPERQQVIVRLFELEGFSAVEIGEMLELADGTVRWHLHQARKLLRESLGAYRRSTP